MASLQPTLPAPHSSAAKRPERKDSGFFVFARTYFAVFRRVLLSIPHPFRWDHGLSSSRRQYSVAAGKADVALDFEITWNFGDVATGGRAGIDDKSGCTSANENAVRAVIHGMFSIRRAKSGADQASPFPFGA